MKKPKKQYSLNSDVYQALISIVPKINSVIDVQMENNWIAAMLDNGVKIKMKQI